MTELINQGGFGCIFYPGFIQQQQFTEEPR